MQNKVFKNTLKCTCNLLVTVPWAVLLIEFDQRKSRNPLSLLKRVQRDLKRVHRSNKTKQTNDSHIYIIPYVTVVFTHNIRSTFLETEQGK